MRKRDSFRLFINIHDFEFYVDFIKPQIDILNAISEGKFQSINEFYNKYSKDCDEVIGVGRIIVQDKWKKFRNNQEKADIINDIGVVEEAIDKIIYYYEKHGFKNHRSVSNFSLQGGVLETAVASGLALLRWGRRSSARLSTHRRCS